jgi:hypothetical protein
MTSSLLMQKPNRTRLLLIAHSYENSSVGRASVPASERRPGTAALPPPAIFHLSLGPQGNDRWSKNRWPAPLILLSRKGRGPIWRGLLEPKETATQANPTQASCPGECQFSDSATRSRASMMRSRPRPLLPNRAWSAMNNRVSRSWASSGIVAMP